MAHLHPAVVRQALQIVWREQGWPLQDMSYEKWEWLGEMIVSADCSTQTLPGDVRVVRNGDVLRATRC